MISKLQGRLQCLHFEKHIFTFALFTLQSFDTLEFSK